MLTDMNNVLYDDGLSKKWSSWGNDHRLIPNPKASIVASALVGWCGGLVCLELQAESVITTRAIPPSFFPTAHRQTWKEALPSAPTRRTARAGGEVIDPRTRPNLFVFTFNASEGVTARAQRWLIIGQVDLCAGGASGGASGGLSIPPLSVWFGAPKRGRTRNGSCIARRSGLLVHRAESMRCSPA